MALTTESVLNEFIGLEGINSLNHFPNLLLVVLILILMWVGKKAFDLFSDYSLEYQLVKSDNKAITVSFVGYLAGVATILEGVLEGTSASLWQDLINVSIWGILGILLLNLAGKINDRFISGRFNNREELLNQHNVGVAVVVAGSYMGSAMIIRSIILGESLGWVWDIGLTIFYFILGQAAFFIYCRIYQALAKYDIQREIQEKNVAAGIPLGLNLLAIGILLAIPMRLSFSIVVFVAWFVLGSTVMVFFRFVMDRMIIPLEKLDEEIHQDKNWGIACLEGCFSIVAVITLQGIFA